MVDVFSKYVVINAMRRSTAQLTVDRIKKNWFLKYGVPERLISDNGPQLISTTFKEFLDDHGVTHWLTAGYHPQANPTEAANKTIGCAIRAYIEQNERHNNWDEHIDEIAFALNSAVHSTTKYSPHQIVYGKPLAVDGHEHDEKYRETADNEKERNKVRKAIAEKVSQNLRSSYERNSARYNLRSRDVQYEPAERVYRRNNKLSDLQNCYSAKLGLKYIPCKIIRRVGSNVYEVSDDDTGRTSICHTMLLKKR